MGEWAGSTHRTQPEFTDLFSRRRSVLLRLSATLSTPFRTKHLHFLLDLDLDRTGLDRVGIPLPVTPEDPPEPELLLQYLKGRLMLVHEEELRPNWSEKGEPAVYASFLRSLNVTFEEFELSSGSMFSPV